MKSLLLVFFSFLSHMSTYFNLLDQTLEAHVLVNFGKYLSLKPIQKFEVWHSSRFLHNLKKIVSIQCLKSFYVKSSVVHIKACKPSCFSFCDLGFIGNPSFKLETFFHFCNLKPIHLFKFRI
jgi:hypothetical protein